MADLQFFEKSHIYMLDGQRLPCVSDLCRFIHREIYQNAPTWQIELAADRGTAVHQATQLLEETGSASIDPSYAPYLQAYAAFLQDHKPEWSLIEHAMYHPEELYAGTIDRYGKLDGCQTLIDIKTTYSVYKPLCAASLNLYRRLLEANHHAVEKLAILHLKKDGTYKLIPFSADDALAKALITLHRALQKRKKGERHV